MTIALTIAPDNDIEYGLLLSKWLKPLEPMPEVIKITQITDVIFANDRQTNTEILDFKSVKDTGYYSHAKQSVTINKIYTPSALS